LDDILAGLRSSSSISLTAGTSSSPLAPSSSPKKPDYAALAKEADVPKLKRLVNAREKSIISIKAILAKKRAA
jgi:hypothetical protein